eukprot:scpid70027/ scgid7256/ 
MKTHTFSTSARPPTSTWLHSINISWRGLHAVDLHCACGRVCKMSDERERELQSWFLFCFFFCGIDRPDQIDAVDISDRVGDYDIMRTWNRFQNFKHVMNNFE